MSSSTGIESPLGRARQALSFGCDPMTVVNVASVPMRSPFRYPGGKTWLVPQIRRWLRHFENRPAHLIEPFAGGATVGLTSVFEHLTVSTTLVEKDQDVAAVWKTILDAEDGPWLAERIVSFDFSPETVIAELSAGREKLNDRDRAFATILRNRVQRGGILAPGAGLMKVGENGRGMASRWYPQTMKNRILAISDSRIRRCLHFIEGDGIEVIRGFRNESDFVFFIDPPYTVAGSRLYTFSELDHEELFRVASELKGDFLMTYDNTEYVRNLAAQFGLQTRLVAMKNTHHAQMTELLIGRDLSWVSELNAALPAQPSQVSLEFESQTVLC